MTSTRPPAVEGTFTIHNFTFESGETMPELRVGYVMYGTLNAKRDNLCLVMPGTGNLRHSTLEHLAPGAPTTPTTTASYAPMPSAVAPLHNPLTACTSGFLSIRFATWCMHSTCWRAMA